MIERNDCPHVSYIIVRAKGSKFNAVIHTAAMFSLVFPACTRKITGITKTRLEREVNLLNVSEEADSCTEAVCA